MKQWDGISSDTSSIGDGCEYAANVSFYLDGEITRRYGMSAFAAQSGTSMIAFNNVMTGRFMLFATDTGTVEAIQA